VWHQEKRSVRVDPGAGLLLCKIRLVFTPYVNAGSASFSGKRDTVTRLHGDSKQKTSQVTLMQRRLAT
jgi:hypothetical protein